MTMNNVNATANDRHEFRANLPWIDKIDPDALAFRSKNGITKTLVMATTGARAFSKFENSSVKQALKADTQALISACNFSASQCGKELRKRGIPFKG